MSSIHVLYVGRGIEIAMLYLLDVLLRNLMFSDCTAPFTVDVYFNNLSDEVRKLKFFVNNFS